MTLHAILSAHGFSAPYIADATQPGTVYDRRGRAIPFLIVPGVLDCTARREFSRLVADQLNAEASAVAARDAA